MRARARVHSVRCIRASRLCRDVKGPNQKAKEAERRNTAGRRRKKEKKREERERETSSTDPLHLGLASTLIRSRNKRIRTSNKPPTNMKPTASATSRSFASHRLSHLLSAGNPSFSRVPFDSTRPHPTSPWAGEMLILRLSSTARVVSRRTSTSRDGV